MRAAHPAASMGAAAIGDAIPAAGVARRGSSVETNT
jgi:hypothetical protein